MRFSNTNTGVSTKGTSTPKKGLGGFLGGLGNTANQVGGVVGIAGSVLASITSLFGGGAKRRSRLVQESLQTAITRSNVESGSMVSINEYLKILSERYQYQFVIKKRKEGSSIKDKSNEVEASLKSAGYIFSHTDTATRIRSKGNYNYTFPVYKEPAVVQQVVNAVTGQDVDFDDKGNVKRQSEKSTSQMYIVIGILAFIFRKRLGLKF